MGLVRHGGGGLPLGWLGGWALIGCMDGEMQAWEGGQWTVSS